jgi:hypothetical protein
MHKTARHGFAALMLGACLAPVAPMLRLHATMNVGLRTVGGKTFDGLVPVGV